MVLILEDHQVVHSSFLQLINSVLSCGEVPGLFQQDELESIISPIREQAVDEGHRGPLHNYFAKSWFHNFTSFVVKIKS